MSKIRFSIKASSRNEIQKSARREWGLNPISRSFKSIKDYDRRAEKIQLHKQHGV